MREILFRGKPVVPGKYNGGSFAFGYYCCSPSGKHYIELSDTNGCKSPVEVNPDTVGQYTGLTDKNGMKIFEGDIVAYEDAAADFEGYHDDVFMNRGVVGLDPWGGVYFSGRQTVEMEDLWLSETEADAEVIGNIHDNPKLLEGTNGN